MKSTQTSVKESFMIGTQPDSSTSSAKAKIYTFEAHLPLTHELENTTSIDDLVAELELDEAMSAELSDARRHLSNTLFNDRVGSLSHLRMEAGFSQAKLASAVGTSQSHIARIEAGRSDPSTETIGKIASSLNVSPVAVFTAVHNQILQRG